jgi:hypothetical protein
MRLWTFHAHDHEHFHVGSLRLQFQTELFP